MSSSKKGKKSKEKKQVLSLQEFLATNQSSGGTNQVAVQKVSSWAEECEDDEDRPTRTEYIELPSAPRSTRILDDDTIPDVGPFNAKVSNLPFDTNDEEVFEFFTERDIMVKDMRLARDDANERLRGFGHIEFQEREDLIAALMLPDAVIRSRRIRIELPGENDRDGRNVRKRYDYTSRDGTANESTNWRERKESNFEPAERDNRRGGSGGYQSRGSFQNRHDSNNNDNNEDGGNWRMGERQVDSSPPPERRRNNFGDRDRDRRGGGRDRYERRDEPEEERPVLKLEPRTKPLPVLTFPKEEELERPSRKVSSLNGDAENHNDSGLPEDEDKEVSAPPPPKPKPVPAVNIFGQAKPVDTAARERAIEEKIEQERLAKIQREKEEREKEREEAEKVVEVEPKKDLIIIKTEKARHQEEAVNWRKHEEPSNEPDNRNRDAPRRFDNDRRRNDDRPRQFNNNRDRNNGFGNNRGDRDFRGGNRGGNIERRDDRRDHNRKDAPRRDGGNEVRREERELKEPRRERSMKDLEERMPKLNPQTGPNLQISNPFAGLDDEVDAD